MPELPTARLSASFPSETSGEPRRAPLPGWLPKGVKRVARPGAAVLVPAHIRVLGAHLTSAEREDIRRKLGMKLGKFADAIHRITVRVRDVNGPRGGIDQACTIKVVLRDHPSVVFEARHKSMNGAVAGALTGTERAVRRYVQRRRMKPLKKQARRVLSRNRSGE